MNQEHFFSEEVCVQDIIDLHDVIAIMLPYETPAQSVANFLYYKEMKLFANDFYYAKIENILNNKYEKLNEAYLKIAKWKEFLASFGYFISCIDSF